MSSLKSRRLRVPGMASFQNLGKSGTKRLLVVGIVVTAFLVVYFEVIKVYKLPKTKSLLPNKRNMLIKREGSENEALLQKSWNEACPEFEDEQKSLPKIKTKDLRIVYIKTHRTASTTLATIIQRYGIKHKKRFALPCHERHVFDEMGPFSHTMVAPNQKGGREFDILANHARYNRSEMEIVVPGAQYITVLRHPAGQFESAFHHWEVAKKLKFNLSEDPLSKFFENPEEYRRRLNYLSLRQTKNGQAFDLGFETVNEQEREKIWCKIEQLNHEMDLVVINEHFDESLLLLKKTFSWDFEDILYLSQGVRQSSRSELISDETKSRIMEWNQIDTLLYLYFNESLWRQIKDYGSSFYKDLEFFRNLRQRLIKFCRNETDEAYVFRELLMDTQLFCTTLDYDLRTFDTYLHHLHSLENFDERNGTKYPKNLPSKSKTNYMSALKKYYKWKTTC